MQTNPVRRADVRLRQGALRAVQAMHAILSHMVLFRCNECKERFPTFHPAYEPPPTVARYADGESKQPSSARTKLSSGRHATSRSR